MPTTTLPEASTGLPDGYRAIPILESEVGAILKLCVLAKTSPDAAAGQLVLLRDLPEAMVYLACLTDASGQLRHWAELWVQNVDGLDSSLPALRETFSNRTLDNRWTAFAKNLSALNPASSLKTGWEARHPLPSFLDVGNGRPVHPKTGDKPWELCQDDAALLAAGLPAYGTSLFRYLYQPEAKAHGFIPVVAGAPTNASTHSLTDTLKNVPPAIPLNAQGGLLMARDYAPLSYEDYVDLLSGKAWKGLEHGKRTITFDGVYRTLGDCVQMQQSGSHLFLGGNGRAGRFVETFHLKLRAFLEAVTAVRNFVADQQLPFLNLSAESFRLRLQDLGTKLPFLWTADCQLCKPPEAFALPVESSELRYFIRARPSGPSIYRPDNLHNAIQGEGNVRIRTVLPPDQGRTLLEGTLVMPQGLSVSPHDLLWIRLPLPIGRVDLYGHLYTEEGLAQGEARFRTVPQHLKPEVTAALRAAEGLSLARSPFEVVPLLSTPCDLYALGILAVRTLLVNPQNTLPVAVDEMLSLARRLASEYKAEVPLAARLAAVFSNEPRFAKSLAPNRLVQEALEPATAFELLPAELWYHTLAAIVRFFPGLGPDSYCQDYGDAPALALETVFSKPMEDLEQLLVRSRSLIVIDWRANREVHSAIRDVLDRQHVA